MPTKPAAPPTVRGPTSHSPLPIETPSAIMLGPRTYRRSCLGPMRPLILKTSSGSGKSVTGNGGRLTPIWSVSVASMPPCSDSRLGDLANAQTPISRRRKEDRRSTGAATAGAETQQRARPSSPWLGITWGWLKLSVPGDDQFRDIDGWFESLEAVRDLRARPPLPSFFQAPSLLASDAPTNHDQGLVRGALRNRRTAERPDGIEVDRRLSKGHGRLRSHPGRCRPTVNGGRSPSHPESRLPATHAPRRARGGNKPHRSRRPPGGHRPRHATFQADPEGGPGELLRSRRSGGGP